MKGQKSLLKVRIDRIRKGYASDPDFVIHAIGSMAKIPFCDYMTTFEEEKDRVLELLSLFLSEEEEAKITYQDVARRIGERMSPTATEQEKANAIEAMKLLVLPFQRYYAEKERNRNYG